MKRITLLSLFILCQIAHVVASIWMLLATISGSERAERIAIAYDRVGNAATGGSDRETISSRAYRGMLEGNRKWCILCKLLNKLEPNHCENSAGK